MVPSPLSMADPALKRMLKLRARSEKQQSAIIQRRRKARPEHTDFVGLHGMSKLDDETLRWMTKGASGGDADNLGRARVPVSGTTQTHIISKLEHHRVDVCGKHDVSYPAETDNVIWMLTISH
eukprot:3619312-Pleurochrysis_carterae.AAC.1